jgi:hypothetical protein
MLNKLFSLFRTKKIAFIDGDQPIPGALNAYQKYIANTGTETHFIRMQPTYHQEPKMLRGRNDINRIYLSGLTAKKEVTDKFIGAYIQRAVSEGYREITVISNDYDFIDIFKMAVQVDSAASKVTFRMIMPKAQGRAVDLPAKMLNIEVIK